MVGGRWPSVEDDLCWKTTFSGRQTLVEDHLRWKLTFGGSRPSVVEILWWKTNLGGIRSLLEDELQWKMTFLGSLHQGGIKYFVLWEPPLLGQYFLFEIAGFTATWGLESFASSCHKKSFSVRKDYFQPKEKSHLKKLFPATKHYFLSQRIISCDKKLLFPTWYWIVKILKKILFIQNK